MFTEGVGMTHQKGNVYGYGDVFNLTFSKQLREFSCSRIFAFNNSHLSLSPH
jgi:hypothetical protein